MISRNIHQAIRYLEKNISLIDSETGREFIKQMIDRLDQYKDRFLCSVPQSKFIWSLCGQVNVKLGGPPKSSLGELKARRAKIIKRQRKDRIEKGRVDQVTAAGFSLVLK